MSIFSKLKRASNPHTRAVAADMKRLNDLQPGLADKVVAYVISGENETVLSTLSTLCKGGELEIAQRWYSQGSATEGRRKFLALHAPYDIKTTKRYAEALNAACQDLPDNAAGSSKTLKLVRVYFSETFQGLGRGYSWPPKAQKISPYGLSLQNAVSMTEALGGSLVDFIDVLYNERGSYDSISGASYREAISVKPLFEQFPSAVIEAGLRIHATSRAELLRDLQKFKLANSPEYRDFVLELAGDSSKVVRELAGSILSAFDARALEPKAVELLAKGNVTMRAGMVELLVKLGSDSGLDALRAHKEKEKTARIISAIDTALTVSSHVQAETANNDNERGYQAIDGSTVEIPPMQPLVVGEAMQLGREDQQKLINEIRQENERIRKRNEETKRNGHKYRAPQISEKLAADTIRLFNASESAEFKVKEGLDNFLRWGVGQKWVSQVIPRFPEEKALRLAAALGELRAALSPYRQGPFVDVARNFIAGPNGDLRHLEAMEIAVGTEHWIGGYSSKRVNRKAQPGDLMRELVQEGYSYMGLQLDHIPADATWPYVAEHFAVLDEAFGLAPQTDIKLSRVAAVRILQRLPKPPARYFGPLLEVATGETKAGRAEARRILADAPEVGTHVATLLNDSRQAIRAGAAEWLADRGDMAAIPALKTRLKKEKSELAKAAILTALDALGEDLSGYVGPKALLEEAEAGLKKAKLDKLDWLGLDHLPAVRYRSNQAIPEAVLKWWLLLAVKLKQPGGNALFDIYLERLNPEDAEKFSTWVLDSWYNYDTAKPAEAEANAYASQHAAARYKSMKRWIKDYSEERAHADLKREFMSNYLNSGAAFKGLLALAKHAPVAIAADRARNYLKNHGSRTSQASSLLELLAAMEDPVTLQVLIAAATRLKQKGVQTFAGELIAKVAEAKSWTMDELGDRTVPSAGLDEDGLLELACGPEEKVYAATISDTLTLEIRNPEGKVIKSLPAGQDDATKAAKKQLIASRRELKQVVAMQSARLYEALCSGRLWPLEDWQRDISEHPIMRKLAERVIWLGLDKDESIIGMFRPTAEGDYSSVDDDDVDIEAFATIRLAHGALIGADEAKAWQEHLKDYEVKPLITQFGRDLLTLKQDQKTATTIDDRKGWVTDTFTFRGNATKLGYERGQAEDAGFFCEYSKSFKSAELLAVIEFSGNCLPEENVPAAMHSLSFERYRGGRRTGGTVKLSDVPPVLLSECWNDYREIVAKAAYDEQWEKKMPW